LDEMVILSHLEALAESLEINVRYEDLEGETDFASGGLCRIKNQYVVFVNDRAPIKEKIQTLAKGLIRFDLTRVYVKPALRDFLEQERGDRG
jgi:hypothetical protein